ncbi:MAG: hypothetical protein IJU90_08305 [Bacteroidales bacterium]|nr:hypothetical protein [Bacteroidales bacterium]
MVRKKTKPKTKSFSVTLSEKDAAMLSRYAKSTSSTRPMAMRRIVRNYLREYFGNAADETSQNQLNLFNVNRQINLLDNID